MSFYLDLHCTTYVAKLNLCMRILLALLIVLAFAPHVYAAELISVDTTKVITSLEQRGIGINTNYLMDDDTNRNRAQSTLSLISQTGAKFLRYPGGEKSDA